MLKVEQLQENVERMTTQNSELENLFRNALQENRKLQDSLDTGKILSDRQTQELQNEKTKINELEKNVEAVTKEKQRLQSFCDTIRKRADDAEKSLSQVNERVAVLQVEADRVKNVEKECEELTGKLSVVEKEHNGMQKEVTRLKEVIEVSHYISWLI